jgi:uncharacterized protein involved in exopolysaccharide biosynthesis
MAELFRDLLGLLRERKRYWLAPLLAVIALLTVLAFFAQGSVVAPFIYTLF